MSLTVTDKRNLAVNLTKWYLEDGKGLELYVLKMLSGRLEVDEESKQDIINMLPRVELTIGGTKDKGLKYG
jgi:hypothetical protein